VETMDEEVVIVVVDTKRVDIIDAVTIVDTK
jgi:hypothetical protein